MISFIAPVIASVSLFQLYSTGKLDDITDAFFENLTIEDQLALMGLIFATIFIAVSASQLVDPLGLNKNKTTKEGAAASSKPTYPIDKIRECKTDRDKFLCLFPFLRDELLAHMSTKNEMPAEALAWCREMTDYNVPGGKLNRGLTVLAVTRALIQSRNGGRDPTDAEVARASVLGWAVEFLQAFFLVADDVMDESQTRRGQPCWYKLPKVKVIAINDSFLLESYVFTLIKTHFGSESCYQPLVDLFLDVIQKTEFGQLLDLTSQPMDTKEVDLSRFTLERYQLIVKYKTAFYSFYLPVAIGMITSGVVELEAYALAKKICCIMGEYFQIQDDYLDCYGDPETIGKVGTDIQDNKCSWLVVQALNRATHAQRKVLEENYGKWDDKKVAKVKALYNELNLKSVFETYEEESYKAIQSELNNVKLVPRDVFELLLKKIYKRSK